jgi:Ca2+/Na+ antiporter
MPQLDKINWFFVLIILIICVSYLLVNFVKYIYYSKEKIEKLKNKNKVQKHEKKNSNVLFSFLSGLYLIFFQRNLFFSQGLQKPATLVSNTVSETTEKLNQTIKK